MFFTITSAKVFMADIREYVQFFFSRTLLPVSDREQNCYAKRHLLHLAGSVAA